MTVAGTTMDLRALREDESVSAVEQVARWLGLASGRLLRGTFPSVYRAPGTAQRWGMFAGDELVSHVAARNVTLVTDRGTAEALLIGSVATAPQHRGRGHATALLDELISRARQAGTDEALLWSSRWRFYERFGFHPAGTQFEVPFHGRSQTAGRLWIGGDAPDQGVRGAVLADVPDILALHERKPLRVRRDLAETALLLAAGDMATMVLAPEERVLAYACLGKGADFQGWWHELGGGDADVERLLHGAMQHLGLTTSTVMMPSYRDDLLPVTAGRRGVCALRLTFTEAGSGDFFVDGLDSI